MVCPACTPYPWVFNELEPNQRIEIFLKGEGTLISSGFATLIHPLPSWREPEPYPVVLHCKKCRKQTNVLDERWLVQYDDGFVTARWIAKLTKQGTIHVEDEYDKTGDDEDEGLLE